MRSSKPKMIVVPHFKVVSTYDVSQTEGEPLPEIATPLTGSVDDYDDFLTALEQVSPVPVSFEDITGRAHGYYSLADKRILVRAGICHNDHRFCCRLDTKRG